MQAVPRLGSDRRGTQARWALPHQVRFQAGRNAALFPAVLLTGALAACSAGPGHPSSGPSIAPRPATLAACQTAQETRASLAVPGVTSGDPVLEVATGLDEPDDLLFYQGQLYVGEFGSGRILALGPTLAPTLLPVQIPEVEGMAVVAGQLYAADQLSDTVVRVNGATATPVVKLSPVAGQEGVDGISAAQGDLIIPDSPHGTVLVTTTKGATLRTIPGFVRPTGVWPLAGGSLLVADEYAGSVVLVSAGGPRTILASGIPLLDEVTENGAGQVDAISIQDGTLLQVSPGPKAVIASGLDQPQGLALDGGQNLVVTEYGNGRVDEVVTTFQPLPGSGTALLSKDQPLCVDVVRGAGFSAPISIVPESGYKVVREPGRGLVGEVLPRHCQSACQITLTLLSGTLEGATALRYQTAA